MTVMLNPPRRRTSVQISIDYPKKPENIEKYEQDRNTPSTRQGIID
jgi:hypothetical protein